MFIPKRCPKCRDRAQWTEIYNPHFTNGLEKLILWYEELHIPLRQMRI